MRRWRWLAVMAVVAATGARAQAPDPDPWFGRDKAVHFAVSASLATLGYAVAGQFPPSRENLVLRLVFGGSAAMTLGVAKEVLDLTLRLGTPSWKDLAWDAAGTVTGLAVAFVVDCFIVRPIVDLVQLGYVRVARYAL